MDLTLDEKQSIFEELIEKTSVRLLLDIIDNKLLVLYNSSYTTRENKITFSKAKTFISKTRTILT